MTRLVDVDALFTGQTSPRRDLARVRVDARDPSPTSNNVHAAAARRDQSRVLDGPWFRRADPSPFTSEVHLRIPRAPRWERRLVTVC